MTTRQCVCVFCCTTPHSSCPADRATDQLTRSDDEDVTGLVSPTRSLARVMRCAAHTSPPLLRSVECRLQHRRLRLRCQCAAGGEDKEGAQQSAARFVSRSLFGASGSGSPDKLDGPCSEPLFWGGRGREAEEQRRSANRPGGNAERPTERAASRLEALFAGKGCGDARPHRPRKPLLKAHQACAHCAGTGHQRCLTCGCSGEYLEPCTESAGVTNYVPCVTCGGSGDELCEACAGRGCSRVVD